MGGLVVSRRVGESVRIGDNIVVTITDLAKRSAVRLHIEAPREIPVRRTERDEELEQPREDPVIYLLWSGHHGAWWRPDERGYTTDVDQAGRYRRDEAIRNVIASAQCGVREQVTSMVAAPENWPVSDG